MITRFTLQSCLAGSSKLSRMHHLVIIVGHPLCREFGEASFKPLKIARLVRARSQFRPTWNIRSLSCDFMLFLCNAAAQSIDDVHNILRATFRMLALGRNAGALYSLAFRRPSRGFVDRLLSKAARQNPEPSSGNTRCRIAARQKDH